MVTQSRNSYVEADLQAPTIDELCKQLEDDNGSYQTHMEGRLQSLLKEAREKSKYWLSCNSSDNTELFYKKVGVFVSLLLILLCWEEPHSIVICLNVSSRWEMETLWDVGECLWRWKHHPLLCWTGCWESATCGTWTCFSGKCARLWTNTPRCFSMSSVACLLIPAGTL